jgi:hypothetical protein
MADEIKLSNSGLSNLRSDAVAGQNEPGDALVAIFSDFWQSESMRISDQDLSKNAAVSGNGEAAIIENNDIKISGMNVEIATIDRLPKSENDDANVATMEDVAPQGQMSVVSKLDQNYFFSPAEETAKTDNLIRIINVQNAGNLITEYLYNPTKIKNRPNDAEIQKDGSLKLEFMSLNSKGEVVLANANEFLPIYDFIDDGAAPINEEADELNITDISTAFSWHAECGSVDDIVFSTYKEIKVNNYRIDYQNVDFRKPSSDFFLHQNIGMTVEQAPIAKLIDETQILFYARNKSGIFKSIIASEDITPKPQMGPIFLKNSDTYMKNNNFLEVISDGKNLIESKYLDISTPESSLTIVPKLKSTEQNSYANLEHPSQILIDGKTKKAIEPVVGLNVTESTDIKVNDDKNTHPIAQSKVIRVDVLKKTWEQQVVSKLVSGIKNNATSIDLILQPKKLGEVSVQIVRDANNVSIKLTSESQNVANLFKATEIQLETLLSQNGMKLAGFTVGYDNQGRDNRNSQQSNNTKNGILLKKKSEKSVQNGSKTESVALSRHVGDYDYLV